MDGTIASKTLAGPFEDTGWSDPVWHETAQARLMKFPTASTTARDQAIGIFKLAAFSPRAWRRSVCVFRSEDSFRSLTCANALAAGPHRPDHPAMVLGCQGSCWHVPALKQA